MEIYRTKIAKLHGTSGSELYRHARTAYKEIASKTKRRPYVRSLYFKKEKVFIDYFWGHLDSKNWNDRLRRLRFYGCALELIRNSKKQPELSSTDKIHKHNETLYRFFGETKEGERFAVQIKEDIKRDEKYFISVFPLP
jgi:hypothetical protein